MEDVESMIRTLTVEGEDGTEKFDNSMLLIQVPIREQVSTVD
jgi:hypothetical protein